MSVIKTAILIGIALSNTKPILDEGLTTDRIKKFIVTLIVYENAIILDYFANCFAVNIDC